MSDDEVLEVDAVVEEPVATPVLADPQVQDVTQRRPVVPVIAQAAAIAATGFAAGAIVAAVVRATRPNGPVKARRRTAPAGTQVVATRSFLIDVHVLAPRD